MVEGIDVIGKLFDVGISLGLLAVAVYYFTKQLSKKEIEIGHLQMELKEYSKDYRVLADKSLTVLTLVDDKLKGDVHSNEIIKDIHRMVGELLDLEKKRG